MFQTLINKIKSILQANTLISIVYDFEVGELRGDPAAVVIPSSNESDYNTMEENIRIYAFTIRLFVKRNAPREPEDADRIMRELVGSVIDDFDKDYTLTGLVSPTGYTFINLFAVPSGWGYSGERDEYRVAEINLRCRVSVDLNQIS